VPFDLNAHNIMLAMGIVIAVEPIERLHCHERLHGEPARGRADALRHHEFAGAVVWILAERIVERAYLFDLGITRAICSSIATATPDARSGTAPRRGPKSV
jgi:hypothetical protein